MSKDTVEVRFGTLLFKGDDPSQAESWFRAALYAAERGDEDKAGRMLTQAFTKANVSVSGIALVLVGIEDFDQPTVGG